MPVVVIATLIPVPEHRDAVIAALEAAAAVVHPGEAGTLLYALHEGRDGRLVMIEKYADGDALRAHGGGDGLAALRAALDGKLSEPMDVQVLTPHPAGTAKKGTL
jgi:quinol monooxygenase YgiN